jgi:hypothetical protein
VNRFVIVALGVLSLVGVYSIVVGRPPFFNPTPDYQPYTPSNYTPPSPYTPPATDAPPPSSYDPYASSGTPPASDPLNLNNYSGYQQLTGQPDPNAEPWPEQALPANGETQNYTFGEAIAPFKIQSQPGSNYLVKLADASTGSTAMTIFVRGGENVETLVPLGSYYVKYASGTTWYGYDHLFGDYHTGYSKADDVFDFTVDGDTVRGFSITLYTVEGGNLSTSGITASEF